MNERLKMVFFLQRFQDVYTNVLLIFFGCTIVILVRLKFV